MVKKVYAITTHNEYLLGTVRQVCEGRAVICESFRSSLADIVSEMAREEYFEEMTVPFEIEIRKE